MVRAVVINLGVSLCSAAVAAQSTNDSLRTDSTAVRLTAITVTATRSEAEVFRVPRPVSVFTRTPLADRQVNSIADLFRTAPGLDVTGVGPTQARPVIRGQRGQRVLLLVDGLRLNNSRRQQDFGEIPSLIDVNAVERVEVVRGPGSVLYGSDAIGGVVNVITRRPRRDGLHGSAGYRFSSHDEQQRVQGDLSGRFGRWSFRASGTYRDVRGYSAPSGSYGDIRLAGATPVDASGVEDNRWYALVGYAIDDRQDLIVTIERYGADSAGFGSVRPEAYAPGRPDIQIHYPRQRFGKLTARYTGRALSLPIGDRIDVSVYGQDNDRMLSFDIGVPIGAPPPAPDSVRSTQTNVSDIRTAGARVEAQKMIGGTTVVTYGGDVFYDRANSIDTSITTTWFAFGPAPQSSTVSPVPNASFVSVGTFAQGEFAVAERARLILGARYQHARASTRSTPGVTLPATNATDNALVAAANAIVDVTDRVSVVGAAGRAFRSPNLVERFFQGPTPEGQGFQLRNTDLKPETSFNLDLGVRARSERVTVEAFVFHNTISDAIRIEPLGSVDATTRLPEFRNTNVDRLRARGLEANADVRVTGALLVGGSYTHLDTDNTTQDQNNPIGDTFSNRITGRARVDERAGRGFVEYEVRHNFTRRDATIAPGNPIGTVLPAFTLHNARAGVRLVQRGSIEHRLTVGVYNLTNTLYAEFANVTFFRPEPGRRILLSYDVGF